MIIFKFIIKRVIFIIEKIIKNKESEKIPIIEITNVLKYNRVIEDILMRKRLKIEVYKVNGNSNFELILNASPGNIEAFDNILFKNRNSTNLIICLYIQIINNQVKSKIIKKYRQIYLLLIVIILI